MRPPLRIAHASDVHLDTDYYGGRDNLGTRDFYREVFATLLERIGAQGPQLLLLPGDLFDSNRATAETIRWALERLAALPFPVVMIPGNHDCLEEGSIYRRYDFSRPTNLTLLGEPAGERLDLAGPGALLWGRALVEHTPEFRPLEGLPAPVAERWNLALAHGIYVGRDGLADRSSPVEAGQIAGSGYDYIALGHHHALLDVSANGTAAWYSGAPVPISPRYRGTFLIVELAEGRPARVTVHALA
jgi:DNA repair exonuclease SbcCD nuclease subunit